LSFDHGRRVRLKINLRGALKNNCRGVVVKSEAAWLKMGRAARLKIYRRDMVEKQYIS